MVLMIMVSDKVKRMVLMIMVSDMVKMMQVMITISIMGKMMVIIKPYDSSSPNSQQLHRLKGPEIAG